MRWDSHLYLGITVLRTFLSGQTKHDQPHGRVPIYAIASRFLLMFEYQLGLVLVRFHLVALS